MTGKLLVAPKVEMGYLEQTAVSGSTRSVWDEARSQMTGERPKVQGLGCMPLASANRGLRMGVGRRGPQMPAGFATSARANLRKPPAAIVKSEAAMAEAAEAMTAGDPKAADRLAAAQEAFEAAGGYDVDRRIGGVLAGLGFAPEQWHKGCDEFSGGWQMRIALARLLLSDAGQAASQGASGGILLLDEPTNHLDRWGRRGNGPGTARLLVHAPPALLGHGKRTSSKPAPLPLPLIDRTADQASAPPPLDLRPAFIQCPSLFRSAAVKWLSGFLATSGGTLVLVSHDEALLEGACDRICEAGG